MLSTLEASIFNVDVYQNPFNIALNDFTGIPLNLQIPLPEGWNRLIPSDFIFSGWGYYGICYFRKVTNTHFELVFAHRGTILSLKNLFQDLEVALNHLPSEVKRAITFVDQTLTNFRKLYPKVTIDVYHTGHSLGAIVAEILTCTGPEMSLVLPGSRHILTITFESPGSDEIYQKLLKDKEITEEMYEYAKSHCCIVMDDVDMINTCNKQLCPVNVLQIDNYELNEYLKPYSLISSNYLLNPYYITAYTLTQHQIYRIYELLKKTTNTEEVPDWPKGFDAGYQAYRSKSRKKYWDQYFKYLWDDNSLRRWWYKSYNEFYDKMISSLN